MDEVTQTPNEFENTEEPIVEKGSPAGLIFLTIFIAAIVGGLIAMPFLGGQGKLDHIFETVPVKWWVTNIGEYHPIILHLPIGIIFLTVFMEVCGWLSFGRFKPMTTLGLFLAIITGALACVTGYFDMIVEGFKGEDWDDHMWAGIGFVGVLALAFLVKVWGMRNGSRGPVYGILLFGAAGVMGFGAHIGGEKTHNEDPIENTLLGLGILSDKTGADQPNDGIDETGDGTDAVAAGPKLPKDKLAFKDVVFPIMDNKCLKCHNAGNTKTWKKKKSNSGLVMDTFEGLLKGGEYQEDDGLKTLVPGDAANSYMITVMNLPEDDDLHMPPKKPGMEKYEIMLMTWWVNQLEKGITELKDKTLSELNAPQEVLDAAAKLMTPEELKAIEDKKKADEDALKKAQSEKREKLQDAFTELKADETFKTALDYTYKTSSELVFSAVSLRANMKDEHLVKLAPVADGLVELKLGATSVTEAALKTELPKMTSLRKLDLSQSQVGDGILDTIAKLENLEWLNLYGTNVTDAGITKLKTLTKLQKLYLWNSKVTPAGGDLLKNDLPNIQIDYGTK